jgi:hypothetical protein
MILKMYKYTTEQLKGIETFIKQLYYHHKLTEDTYIEIMNKIRFLKRENL